MTGVLAERRAARAPAPVPGLKAKTLLSVPTAGLLTAAAVVTSLRGLPVMAKEELTMFVYIGFATVLFLIPAFFLISTVTISLYIVMYLLTYAAAIRLRYPQPDLPRSFRIPGGTAGMWVVAGGGSLAVAFSLLVSFFPPAQLPVGNPAVYVALVAGGLVVFVAAALLSYHFRKPSWREHVSAVVAPPPPLLLPETTP